MRQFLDLDRRFTIAHRGGSRLRPENTMAAFDHAVELGVDAIELDVHLSRDGHAVVIHDPTLQRTTTGTGAVADCTADELARFNVPTLKSVLERHREIPFMIELKQDSPVMVRSVTKAVDEAHAVERVSFGSFSLSALTLLRATGRVLTSASVPEVTSALVRSKFFMRPPRNRSYQLFQVPEIVPTTGSRVVSPRFVRLARAAGLPVQVWVVDEADDVRRLLQWGVTGFISDRPDVVKATLAAAAPGAGEAGG
jgi:glycerophosphoryl diester phosphodiesterase